MTLWVLYVLIAAAWLTYPFFGATWVAAQNSMTDPPGKSGFSSLPELIIYPPIFCGVAFVIDSIAMPWDRWIVAMLCVIMLLAGTIGFIQNVLKLRRNAKRR